MKDFAITPAGVVSLAVPHPCALVWNRTDLFATGACVQRNLYPVYRCPIHDLCSPFGEVRGDEVVSCVNCEDRMAGPRPNDVPPSASSS